MTVPEEKTSPQEKIVIGPVIWTGFVTSDSATFETQYRFFTSAYPKAWGSIAEGNAGFNLDAAGVHQLELLYITTGEPPWDKEGYQVGYRVADIEQAADRVVAAGATLLGQIKENHGRLQVHCEDPTGYYFTLMQPAAASSS